MHPNSNSTAVLMEGPHPVVEKHILQGDRNGNMRSGVCTFTLGKWPPGCGRISKEIAAFRTLLKAQVVKLRGEVSAADAKLIQSACRHEGAAQLYHRWLRVDYDNLTHFERMGYLAKFEDATDKCDNCLKRLGLLEREANNPWEGVRRIQAKRAETREKFGVGSIAASKESGEVSQPVENQHNHRENEGSVPSENLDVTSNPTQENDVPTMIIDVTP